MAALRVMEVQRVRISWALGLGGTLGGPEAISTLVDLADCGLSEWVLESVLMLEPVLKLESVLVLELRRSERLISGLLSELGLTLDR